MSLRILWNHLIPVSRRRRYFLQRAVANMVDQGADPSCFPEAFGASSPEQFADWMAGRSTPRLFAQSIAILTYRIRQPSSSYTYGPLITLTFAGAGVAAVLLVLHFLNR